MSARSERARAAIRRRRAHPERELCECGRVAAEVDGTGVAKCARCSGLERRLEVDFHDHAARAEAQADNGRELLADWEDTAKNWEDL